MNKMYKHDIWALIFFLALVGVACCSCKSTSSVENTTEIHTDTIYISKQKTDSIWIHDSIYEKEYIQGDTVILYKYVEKVRYKDRLVLDTIYKSKIDTVYQYKKEVVTKEVSFFSKVKTGLFSILIGGLLAGLAYVAWKVYRIFS